MKQIIMLGAGGFALEVLDTIDAINKHSGENITPIGFVYEGADKDKGKLIHDTGIPVLGDISCLQEYDLDQIHLVAAVGRPAWRRKMVEKAKKSGAKFTSVIHPTVTISKRAKIGEGAIMMRYVNIQAGAVIGDFFTADDFAGIGHNMIVGDFVHMCPRVGTEGGAVIGNDVFVGIRATILSCKIGDGAVIGACALITRDVPPNMLAKGLPAKHYDLKEKNY
jgi:sugar O-acyltransferase (sialic acid O-acetyltransferase NeuD family)